MSKQRESKRSEQTVEVVVVGSGATGSLVASRLVDAGLDVVIVEAGQRFRGLNALENTEANAAKITWGDGRNHVGDDFVVPKTGVGVGGGTLAWLAVMPRFHPSDFRTYSTEGVGTDWPIGYDELRTHYGTIENEFGVAGECGPFAPEEYELPMPAHPMNWHAQVLSKGATKLGAHPFAPPIAVNSKFRDGRPACIRAGWCASGCPIEAKATAANTYLRRAEEKGARLLSESFVHRVTYNKKLDRVTGVDYLDSMNREHHINAKLVVLAAHAVETPRLLLMSSVDGVHPDGLANSSGMVGKNFMSHPTWQVFGTFDQPINAYKGLQMGHVMIQDYYKPNPANAYKRGYILLSYMMTPVTFGLLSGLSYGKEFKERIHEYTHTAAWWVCAEGLPYEHNRVVLDPNVVDSKDLPVARVEYSWGDNDVAVSGAGRDKAAELMAASGARDVWVGLNYGAHAMGSCRMGADPASSVVNEYCQTHDVRNLFICDTSTFVTGAGVNPTLTAMAIANRASKYIVDTARKGELS